MNSKTLSSKRVRELLRAASQTRILVVGDVMLDRYVYGAVERVSPEAPVPILTIERELAMPGGAGNVVRNLTALGAAVAFISVVGDDQAGSDLTGLIGGQPNIEPWLLVQGGRTTTLKTRFLSAGQHLLRADREETSPIQPRLAERLLRIARDAMAATSVTVLSDYRKGLLAGDLRDIQAHQRFLCPVHVWEHVRINIIMHEQTEVVPFLERHLAAGQVIPGPCQIPRHDLGRCRARDHRVDVEIAGCDGRGDLLVEILRSTLKHRVNEFLDDFIGVAAPSTTPDRSGGGAYHSHNDLKANSFRQLGDLHGGRQ